DSIHYVPTQEEEIAQVKELTLERVKQLYNEQLAGQAGELAVVGDFDPDALVKQVGEFLDGWKSEVAYRRVPRQAYPDRKPENIEKVDKAIKEEIEKFLTRGVEEKELSEGIKAYLEGQKNGRASDAGMMAQLAAALAVGRTMEFAAEREKAIAALTVDQVSAA